MLASGKNAQPADNISQLLVCDKLKSRSIIPLRQMATNGLQKKCITVCSLKQMTYGANHPPFKALVVVQVWSIQFLFSARFPMGKASLHGS
jgi:hypothetical protein